MRSNPAGLPGFSVPEVFLKFGLSINSWGNTGREEAARRASQSEGAYPCPGGRSASTLRDGFLLILLCSRSSSRWRRSTCCLQDAIPGET